MKDRFDNFKKKFGELKRNAKQLRTKIKNIGWYASSFKSFGKLGKYIDTHWVSVTKDQIATLNNTLYTITDIKIVINIVRYVTDSIVNIIKIRENGNDEKKKILFNNLVRVFRIISYMAIIALSIASVSLGLPGLMIALSSLKLLVRVVNMVKNIKSYIKISREQKEFLATLPEDEKELTAEQIKQKAAFTYKLKKREGRFLTRSVSMFFSIAILAVVIVAVMSSNPLLFAALIFVGIGSTIASKIAYFIKDRRMIPYKTKPDYRVWTKKEILGSYEKLATELGQLPAAQPLEEQVADFDVEGGVPAPRTRENIEKDILELDKANDDKKWSRGQFVFNLSLIAVIVGISIGGIVIANSLLLIPASLLTGALLVIQFVIPTIKKKIQARKFESEEVKTEDDLELVDMKTSHDFSHEVISHSKDIEKKDPEIVHLLDVDVKREGSKCVFSF